MRVKMKTNYSIIITTYDDKKGTVWLSIFYYDIPKVNQLPWKNVEGVNQCTTKCVFSLYEYYELIFKLSTIQKPQLTA